MSVKDLARATAQGGHTGSFNHACRTLRRKERRDARRFIEQMLEDPECDALVPSRPVWDYDRDRTGRSRPFRRWLDSHKGKSHDAVRAAIARIDRTDNRGRSLLFGTYRWSNMPVDRAHLDARYRLMVADNEGMLCPSEAFEWPEREYRERKETLKTRDRQVVDRCGDLFWVEEGRYVRVPYVGQELAAYEALPAAEQRAIRKAVNPDNLRWWIAERKLVPFTERETELFHGLSGYGQRDLRRVRRFRGGKVRQIRKVA